MNVGLKVFIATLGAINAMFSIALPLLVSILIIINVNLTSISQITLIIIGILSSLYRAIDIGFLKTN